eukprot:7208076-Prymnesium_polylepis.1
MPTRSHVSPRLDVAPSVAVGHVRRPRAPPRRVEVDEQVQVVYPVFVVGACEECQHHVAVFVVRALCGKREQRDKLLLLGGGGRLAGVGHLRGVGVNVHLVQPGPGAVCRVVLDRLNASRRGPSPAPPLGGPPWRGRRGRSLQPWQGCCPPPCLPGGP